jgi:hypothetical protein
MKLGQQHGIDTSSRVFCKPDPRVYTLVAQAIGLDCRCARAVCAVSS